MIIPDDITRYLADAVQFLSNHSWIFKESNTKFVESHILDNIPKSWCDTLENLSCDDFNNFPAGSVDGGILPEDLHKFLELVKQLKIKSHTTEKTLKPSEKIKGMSPKKSHEVIRLADVIKTYCDDVDVLVDLGCGLVSIKF